MAKKIFINGFSDWQETHFEIVREIAWQINNCSQGVAIDREEKQGLGGLYELAEELTDKFESNNRGKEWEGEFFEQVEDFCKKELYNEK